MEGRLFSQAKNFVHLHLHSHYSTLDGAIRIDDLLRKTGELGMPAVAVTDHGNMFSALDLQTTARKMAGKGGVDVKPIIGCELYLTQGSMADRIPGERPFHLLALAENEEGYHNLCRLVTMSFIEGFYRKPRVDRKALADNADGIILGSACLSGEIPSLLLQGKRQEAADAAMFYREIAGADNFFFELMDHGIEAQRRVNRELVSLARRMDISLFATNDAHFLNKEDYEAHDILLCIGTGRRLNDEKRFRFSSEQYYLKNAEEMWELFGEVPDALTNTLEIAERCNVQIETTDTAPPERKYKIPTFPAPAGKTEAEYLRELCEAGLKRRYPEITSEIRERLDYELGTIEQMGFPGYFLIVWDLVNYARTHDIPVGPGRGSAAGSLVAYTAGITDIDPLKYDLFFERFLNPGRISMPDIDTDFCVARRGRIIEYLRKQYGASQVAQIITYNYLKARAAVKDVARVLDIPFDRSNEITGLIPPDARNLNEAFNKSEELRRVRAKGGVYETLFRNAFRLENVIRHTGVHAAGVVISNRPLVEYIPLYKDNSTGSVVAQFDGPNLEYAGLVKMDILGLENLTTMKECLRLVQVTRGVDLNLDEVGLDDQRTYDLLKSGRSLGVFQLESPGMQKLLRDMQPDVFTEIIALIALYRPGPLNMGMHEEFVKRKSGAKKVTYAFPELEPILRDTYGVIVYQEQVMQISRTIGGFSMAEADNLRKAMGKKIMEKVASMKSKFMEGAKKNKFDLKIAEELYERMAQFAEYGFNKSHSAAYALISYRTAWLKANYPVEYLAALLTSKKDKTEKLAVYIQEAREMGIQVLPPDVNFSEVDFSVDKNAVRFGLSAIKGVGETVAETIVSARDRVGFFKTLDDFCKEVDMQVLNRRVTEVLIGSGAFSSTGQKRSVLTAQLEYTMLRGANLQADVATGQGNFFDMFGEEDSQERATLEADLDEWPESECFAREKELLGAYVSGHPMDRYRETVARLGVVPVLRLEEQQPGRYVVAGIVRSIQKMTGKDGRPFARVTVEDLWGEGQVMLFAGVYKKYRNQLNPDAVCLWRISVTIPRRDKEGKRKTISCERVSPLEDEVVHDLHIWLKDTGRDNSGLLCIRERLLDSRNKGRSPVYLHVAVGGGRYVTIRANKMIAVNPSEALMGSLTSSGYVDRIQLQ